MVHIDEKRDELTFNVLFILSEILLDVGIQLLKSVWGLEGHPTKELTRLLTSILLVYQ